MELKYNLAKMNFASHRKFILAFGAQEQVRVLGNDTNLALMHGEKFNEIQNFYQMPIKTPILLTDSPILEIDYDVKQWAFCQVERSYRRNSTCGRRQFALED